jgi:hypothetical protein
MKYLMEKLTTEICGEYDVIVAGSGTALVAEMRAVAHHG